MTHYKSDIAESLMSLTLMILVGIALTGCSKLSHNGDLDGQWQVIEVTDATQTLTPPSDVIFYYNFYLHTFQLSFTGKRSTRLTGNLSYEKDSEKLALDLGFVIAGKVDPTIIKLLPYWGMPESGEVVMQIKELSSSRLVMQHDDVVIVCRKF